MAQYKKKKTIGSIKIEIKEATEELNNNLWLLDQGSESFCREVETFMEDIEAIAAHVRNLKRAKKLSYNECSEFYYLLDKCRSIKFKISKPLLSIKERIAKNKENEQKYEKKEAEEKIKAMEKEIEELQRQLKEKSG